MKRLFLLLLLLPLFGMSQTKSLLASNRLFVKNNKTSEFEKATPGNLEQQMKNCCSDLEKILQHYGYSFDDVVAENIYTTNMVEFERVSAFRNSIYKKQFPTGTWLEVKGLAIEGQLIEIDMEAHKEK